MLGSHGQSPKRSWKRVTWSRGSPLAVGRKQTLGTSLPVSARTNRSSASRALPHREAAAAHRQDPPRIRRRSGGCGGCGHAATGSPARQLIDRRDAEVADRQLALDDGAAALGVDERRPCPRARGDDLGELGADEVQRGRVARPVAGRHPGPRSPRGRPRAGPAPRGSGRRSSMAASRAPRSAAPGLRESRSAPASNQHSAPAEPPHRITPASHASRRKRRSRAPARFRAATRGCRRRRRSGPARAGARAGRRRPVSRRNSEMCEGSQRAAGNAR